MLAKATITLTSPEKGLNRSIVTDASGRYLFSQLPPATYALAIKAKGFESYQQSGIILNAAQTATVNVTMTVGAESQSITVTADASQLNIDNSNVAADIDSKQIVELPLNVRNVYGLATLNSSVTNTSQGQMLLGGGGNATDNADQDISFMAFAGGFFGSSAFLIDGSWDTDPEWGAVVFVPSVDATQEFKIQNNSFTAQYGWSTGNVVNVVTKSGTSNFHGSAYEFYTNEKLNALNYFSTSNNQLSRNQTGASAGGPLYIPGLYRQRNKTFIFGLYEHFMVSEPTQSQYTVPDAQFLAGDFSELLGAQGVDKNGNKLVDYLGRPMMIGQVYDPHSAHYVVAGQADNQGPYATGLTAVKTGWVRNPIAGNKLSNLAGYVEDPIAAKIISFYPKGTGSSLQPNLLVSATAPGHSDEYNIRVDHNINDSTNAYFRYSYKEEFKTGNAANWGGDDPAGPGNDRPNNRWGMWAGLTKVFSPSFTMNIASGVQIWHETSNNQSQGFDAAKSLGMPTYLTQNSPIFPQMNVGGLSAMGVNGNDQQGVTNHGPIGTVTVDFIKMKGPHTLNFGFMGVEQVESQHVFTTPVFSFNGGFTNGPDIGDANNVASGSGLAEMMLGEFDSASAGTAFNPLVSNHLLGEYFQDDWKPTHNLTLNLGIRYELQTPYTYRHNAASIFNMDEQNPLSAAVGRPLMGALQFLGPGNRYVYNMNKDNIAPRVGFSYQPTAHGVIHGGYGIFYPQSVFLFPGDADGWSAVTYANSSLDGGYTFNPNIGLASPWGGTYAQITGNANGEYQQVGNGVGGVFRNRPSPYVQQWMLGVQYGITPSDQIDVNYIGNRGVRMVGNRNYNQLDPKYFSQYTADQLKAAAPSNPFAAPLQALEQGGTIASSSCNLDNANATVAQLLAPLPQYCIASVSQADAPVGESLYNALQVTYNHKVTKGLTALVSYTYSKFLDNVEGHNGWSYNGPTNYAVTPANNYNLAADKSVDAGDIPQALVASYTYELPVGRGKVLGSGMSRIADAVVGGWELSGIATFRQGIPLGVFGSNWTSYGGNPRPDVIGNPSVSHKTIHEWFNTGAFQYASYGTFGTSPRFFSNVRGPGYDNWDTTIEKNWRFRETMRAQFRFETFNTFNHPNYYAPGAGNTQYSGCDPNADKGCGGTFGQVTSAFPGRSVQWAGKFYW